MSEEITDNDIEYLNNLLKAQPKQEVYRAIIPPVKLSRYALIHGVEAYHKMIEDGIKDGTIIPPPITFSEFSSTLI